MRERVDRAVAVAGIEAITAVVPSFLSAMGDLTERPAQVIIGPVQAMAGMIESTAAALRQLAPDIRLVVTATPDQQHDAQAAVRAGFDAALIEPFDTNEIAKAMDLATPPTPSPAPGSLPGHARRNVPGRSPGTRGSDLRVLPQTPEASAAPPPSGGAGEASGDAGKTSGGSTETSGGAGATLGGVVSVTADQLGDADLIDTLLLGGDPVELTALKIIEAQSGVTGISRLGPGHEIPARYAQAAIRYRGDAMGSLIAPPPATDGDLTPWAHWLARWLAMDDQLRRLKDLSMRDELTGLWNRRYFNRFLARILNQARTDRQQVTLLVFDIDDFKRYNDRYGHAAGDEILREAARLMQSVVRDHDVVARIGGDEFAVIFWDADQPRRQGSTHPHDVRRAARRFQEAICAHRFPKLAEQAPGTLTISGGLAGFPWDGQTPEALLEAADMMAMQSKRQGKNAITFGPGALGDDGSPASPPPPPEQPPEQPPTPPSERPPESP